MSAVREPVVVRTPLPADLLAPIERWYLSALFRTGEEGGCLSFHNPDGLPSFATVQVDDLRRLVRKSIQTCPDLCSRFLAILDDVGADEGLVQIDLGEGIEWTQVLRGLCRRDPHRVPFVEIEIAHLPTSGHLLCGGSAVFVYPDGIEWFSTAEWLRRRVAALDLPLLHPDRTRSARS